VGDTLPVSYGTESSEPGPKRGTHTRVFFTLVLGLAPPALVGSASAAPPEAPKSSGGSMAHIRVNAGSIRHTMASGIGASWHALARDMPLENEQYEYPVDKKAPRGSAWGGNPPVSDARAWERIEAHARWLGLDFFRVEVDQRMYQPERDRFDWAGEEMQALYRILDTAERLGADVFLQQMWRHVEWNAWPGVHPLISAPRSLEEHARGLATLVEHLTARKGYRCIRWLSIANEPPGGTWSYWWEYGDAPAPEGLTPITPALAVLRRELDSRGIDLPLSAPDWTDLPPFPEEEIDFDAHVGAYDIHTYEGLDDAGQEIVSRWADWARKRGKPFLLTEFGNQHLGWGDDDPGPASYAAVLSNAEVVIRALNAGVDGLNRWSFTNRGDLDGQWQLVRTWDRDRKVFLTEVRPEPVPYYGYGLLTRFVAKGSRVLDVDVGATDGPEPLAAAVMSPGGQLTVLVLNLSEDELSVSLQVDGAPTGPLHRYQADEARLGPSFRMDPLRSLPTSEPAELGLPARSLAVLSTFDLGHEDDGVTTERDIEGGVGRRDRSRTPLVESDTSCRVGHLLSSRTPLAESNTSCRVEHLLSKGDPMDRRDFSKKTLLLGLGATAASGSLRRAGASVEVWEEPPKKLPVRRFDVVVAGGGTAGVFAALSAARQGARTILIESKGYCGGTATEGGTAIHSFYNLYTAFPGVEKRKVVRGIPDEFIQRLTAMGGCSGYPEMETGRDYDAVCTAVDVELYKLLAFEMLAEAGVHVAVNTLLTDAIRKGSRLEGVITESHAGREAVMATSFIDCTGYGDLCARAGADFSVPDDYASCNSFGLANASIEDYHAFLKSHDAVGQVCRGRDGEEDQFFRMGAEQLDVPGLSEGAREIGMSMVTTTVRDRYLMFVKCNYEVPGSVLDRDDMARAEMEVRKRMARGAQLLREHVPGFEKAFMARSSPSLCIRRGRRIACDYDITHEDVIEGRHFEDDVFTYGFHDMAPRFQIKDGGTYGIPYRALCVGGIDNLYAAGMMITSDHRAHMSTRNTVSCMGQGQATGTAAALCAERELGSRGLSMTVLRDALIEGGVYFEA
jgi:hypothetical protein